MREATVGYLKAQIAAGAAAVQLFDTWCGELALADYEAFALPAVQEIISRVGGDCARHLLHQGIRRIYGRGGEGWRGCLERGLAGGFA